MIEPVPGKKDTFRFYYEILEEDSQGKTPNDDQFQKCNKSFLYKISRSGNKVLGIKINTLVYVYSYYIHNVACAN